MIGRLTSVVFSRAIQSGPPAVEIVRATDSGTLLPALIRTSVLSECGCALLGGCRRVYLSLLAEASRLFCLERQLCML